jgi:hypothetical protein
VKKSIISMSAQRIKTDSKRILIMITKNKTLVYLLVIVVLMLQIVPVAAQGKTPPNPDQLTATQMKKAVVVSDGSNTSRSNTLGDVYRFVDCDGSNPDAPCYFIVTGNGTFTQGAKSSITPLASSGTITCGVNVYNGMGAKVARLQQNVNATFSGTYGQTPVTLNWGDLRGTGALPGYGLSGLTGPNSNPGWGVLVSRTGSAYSTAGGTLTFLGVYQNYVSSRLTIRSSGWSCS